MGTLTHDTCAAQDTLSAVAKIKPRSAALQGRSGKGLGFKGTKV